MTVIIIQQFCHAHVFNFTLIGWCVFSLKLTELNIIIKPIIILIQVYPHKQGWPDLPQQQSL